MAHKMNYDQSLNKNTERKLKEFVQKLKKILDKNSVQEFTNFALKHNISPKNNKEVLFIRSKNSSSNTQPEETEESEVLP